MNLFPISVAALLLSLSGSVVADDPLFGTWQNHTNGDTVGLTLVENGDCQISIERAYQNPIEKACKYEPFEQRFLVFLVRSDGSCGSNPDFEFSFDAQAPLVQLYIQGSPMILNKVDSASL